MIINPLLPLPRLPKQTKDSDPEVVRWAADMQKVVGFLYQTLASRVEEMIQQGVIAKRPAASGKNLFFWTTDTHHLYYDDGAWRTIV